MVFLKGKFKPRGIIKIGEYINENDWLLASRPANRFEDRRFVTEAEDEQQDWGKLPKTGEVG